jgi:NTP pyrophosphatase (non-canonical NTP hydrolase)
MYKGDKGSMGVRPLPCVRDEHGEIKEQTVKQLLQKINEELDELKQALFIRKYFLDMDEHVAEEAADTITAITTMLEALGIDAEMRDEAQRRVNEKNRERGRL